jgi:hypothetical protein
MSLIGTNTKDYEKPESGDYIGTIIDVVNYVEDQPKFGKKDVPVVRIVWVLNANDSEGAPFRAVQKFNASMHEKSNLYDAVKSILGTAPPVPYESEELLGISKRLVIEKETGSNGKVYANIKAILRLPPNTPVPGAPAGFVRSKDKPNNTQQSQRPRFSAPASAPAPAPAQAKTAAPAAAQAAPQADVKF